MPSNGPAVLPTTLVNPKLHICAEASLRRDSRRSIRTEYSAGFRPRITIVTIAHNSASYIEDTITSVGAQTYTDIEYIIIDGASQDETLSIIRQHSSYITKIVSEPDRGISHAMNKGIGLAEGDFILFLHSDDYLVGPNAIAGAVSAMDDRAAIHIFDIYLLTGGILRPATPRGFDWRMNFKNGVFHQAAFCRRELFDLIGPFDEQFSISMDYDWFLRAYRAKVSMHYHQEAFSVMRTSGISSRLDWPTLSERFRQQRRLQRKNRNALWFWLAHAAFWASYLPYRRLRELLRRGPQVARTK